MTAATEPEPNKNDANTKRQLQPLRARSTTSEAEVTHTVRTRSEQCANTRVRTLGVGSSSGSSPGTASGSDGPHDGHAATSHACRRRHAAPILPRVAPVENSAVHHRWQLLTEPRVSATRGGRVYDVQDWAEVRRLHRDGWSNSAIAEKFGMSRNTVAALLAKEEPPRYERTPVGSMLDRFADAIAAMLDEDPKAPATVIRERLQRLGYAGWDHDPQGTPRRGAPEVPGRPELSAHVVSARRARPVRLVGDRHRDPGRQGRDPSGVRAGDEPAALGRDALPRCSRSRRRPPTSARRWSAVSSASAVCPRRWCSTTTPRWSSPAVAAPPSSSMTSPRCSARCVCGRSCCGRATPRARAKTSG